VLTITLEYMLAIQMKRVAFLSIITMAIPGCARGRLNHSSLLLEARATVRHHWVGPTAPFRAEFVGTQQGIGTTCVVIDPPPYGAWTLVINVVEPGESDLEEGQQLCAIVHSPTSHQTQQATNYQLDCRVALHETPTGTPLWACGNQPIPTLTTSWAPMASTTQPALDVLEVALDSLAVELDRLEICPGRTAEQHHSAANRLLEVVSEALHYGDEEATIGIAEITRELAETIRHWNDEKCRPLKNGKARWHRVMDEFPSDDG